MGWFDRDTSQQVKPYKPAKPVIDQVLGQLGGLPMPTMYGGPTLAGFNPMQMAALSGMGNFGGPGGMGGNIAGMMLGGGMNAMGQLGQAGNMFSQLGSMQGNIGGGPAPQVGQLDFDYAQSIADSPYADSMIAAALRDPARQLTEQTLPGIQSAAAGAGGLGGSRGAVMEAVANRGYEDRAADISAGIRGNLYDQGLNIAQQQATMNPQLQLKNMGLGLQQQGLNQDAMRYGAAGLAQLGGMAPGMLGQAYSMGQNNLGMQLGAGDRMQQQTQAEMSDAERQHYMGQQLPLDFLNNVMGIAMQPGGTFTTTDQNQSMGIGSAIAGIGAPLLASAMAGGMNPFAALGGMFGGGGNPGMAPGFGGMGMPAYGYGMSPQGGYAYNPSVFPATDWGLTNG